MKVLVGFFTAESNTFSEKNCTLDDFVIKESQEMQNSMQGLDVFRKNNIDIIPSIYANGYAQGMIDFEAFDYIEKKLLNSIKENIDRIDGIYLFLHGGSYVKDLVGNSGEHHLIDKIREIVGPYFPIAVVMDPHGNISKDFIEKCTLVRCYRESPHTDIDETYNHVAELFSEFLNNRKDITPTYLKIPIMLGGERSSSKDEPLKSINVLLDEIESNERILSASYHIGFVRQDNYTCGAGVVVIPSDNKYRNDALKKAQEIKNYVLDNKERFHFTGNAKLPEEALKEAMDYHKGVVIVSDSGDNTTAGAPGNSLFMLKQLLDIKNYHHKKILISAITDISNTEYLLNQDVGKVIHINLGERKEDKLNVSATILKKGKLKCLSIFGSAEDIVGEVVLLKLDKVDITLIVSNHFTSFAEINQFTELGIHPRDYDIVIVKQGYIFPELEEVADHTIMSLTPGDTYQLTENLEYKRIYRPMYPIDQF
ncbi:M81 family metallopeptidase [Mammaliicoccus vitulinus]|uniref:M81 family metallopeptidase n=1 Tax=Mammaliicoccus vitulinus TaxID=71237 RepID=UPI0018690C31|nr:M81 family metallopeptidase [Mammaliicoccus vitulinus]